MKMSPPLIVSSPAIMRSVVDLPQPDGPTSTRNSRSAISSVTSSTTTVSPNFLLTDCSRTDAMAVT